MTFLFSIIAVQALLGAFDNLWHHEIRERLPSKRAATPELSLHATREFLYGCIFLALAWYEWQGAWALLLAGALLAEVAITLADFVIEDRTRRLAPSERILHTILAIAFGIILAALVPVLERWWSAPTALVGVHYGAMSWLLTVFSIGAFAWCVRNFLAVLRHRRPQEWVRDPISPPRTQSGRTILVTGATGFIGGHLVRRLIAQGDTVIVLTRDADKALERFGPHVRIVTSLSAIDAATRITAFVNLAGARILSIPWTRARRRLLLASRVETTRALVQLCTRLAVPPRVLVSASAIGYYGVRGDEPLTERAGTQPLFQSQLCREWEEVATAAESVGTRVVCLRIGLVLARDGGALPQLARPVRFGMGAVIGSGRQWVSWIHLEDLLRLISWMLRNPALRGPVNAVAPEPVTNRDLQRAMAQALRRPLGLRIPAALLRTALGEMAQLLVEGQRVVPARALAAGFVFRFPNLPKALADLWKKDTNRAVAIVPTQIYYNGECPVCLAEMTHYAKLCADPALMLRFIDSMQQPDAFAECGLRREHLERRIYLRDARGRVVSGMPAMLELWSRMPRYQRLSRILAKPLVREASAALYDHVVAPGLALWARTRRKPVAVSGLNQPQGERT